MNEQIDELQKSNEFTVEQLKQSAKSDISNLVGRIGPNQTASFIRQEFAELLERIAS